MPVHFVILGGEPTLSSTQKLLMDAIENLEEEQRNIFGGATVPRPVLELTEEMSIGQVANKLRTWSLGRVDYAKQLLQANSSLAQKGGQQLQHLQRQDDELRGTPSNLGPVEADKFVLLAQELEAQIDKLIESNSTMAAYCDTAIVIRDDRPSPGFVQALMRISQPFMK